MSDPPEKLVKVRVHLSALTRLSYTFDKMVPESLADTEQNLVDLANEAYFDSDAGEFEEDIEYWEKGDCWAEKVEKRKNDVRT